MGKATNKFDGVRFRTDHVRPWTEIHDVSAEGFRCLRPEFNTFWKKGQIRREVNSHLSRCWILEYRVFLPGDITMLADRLSVEEQLLLGEEVKYRRFPAVNMGVLAADRRTHGAGCCMME